MIEVQSIAPLATVQDLGRFGHWFQGLGQAGVMDVVSHRMANRLLGNADEAATLEISLTPARFRFLGDLAFAIAGATCNARLAGRALPCIWAGVAREGQVLELGRMIQGARIYLALPGGIDVPAVLGSRSTQLRESFGGVEGRMLVAGDRLRPVASDWLVLPDAGLSIRPPVLRTGRHSAIELKTLPSAEYDSFTPAARQAFWTTAYRVSAASNRQGYRLDGEALARRGTGELRSHGIVPGIVQVPGSGMPIIQLADSATMGGYPAIGAVIETDLWRIGQARPGDTVRFVRTDIAEAATAERRQRDFFHALDRQLARTRDRLSC